MPRDCYTIYDVVKGKKYIDLENVVVSGVKKSGYTARFWLIVTQASLKIRNDHNSRSLALLDKIKAPEKTWKS